MGGRHQSGNKTYVYYYCTGARYGVPCDSRRYIREATLYDQVMGVLREIASSPDVADASLAQRLAADHGALVAQREVARAAIATLDGKRRRWDDAYEAEAIDRTKYQERVSGLLEQRDDLNYCLARVERQLAKSQAGERRRDDLFAHLTDIPELEDRQRTKAFFRRVIEQIIVTNAELERLVL
jgi:hypothetical protein